ncbi:MAG: transcription termination factor NusA [Eubacteriales bacterium]
MNNDFFDALRLLVKEKGISMDALCDGIQKAIVTAAKRDYNNKDIVFCDIDPKEQIMRVYVRKTVVEEIMDPDAELLPEQAQKYSPNALPGDIIEIDLDPKEVSRIAADKGKHLLRQGIREAENSNKSEKLQSRNQEIVSAKVQRVDPNTGNLTVEFDGIEETLLKTEQIPNETFREGELIKVYVVDVKDSNKNKLKVTISRTHPGLVKRLFETEVPEIFDGTVEIKAVSREAGSRTKMAVHSSAPDIDPVGACIGQRGARVNKIVDQLGGEKIDIVKYSDSPESFIASALAPADVIEVIVDEKGEKSCKVIVPDGQLSLAIGNKGQNVRLAAKLTGWKIDIKPESGTQEDQVIHYEL